MQRTILFFALLGASSWTSTVEAAGPPEAGVPEAPTAERAPEPEAPAPDDSATPPEQPSDPATVPDPVAPAEPEVASPEGTDADAETPPTPAVEEPPTSQATPGEGCPCDGSDWQCIENTPGCGPEPAPGQVVEPAPEPAPISRPAAEFEEESEPEYLREGFMLGLSAGIAHCGQQDCSAFTIAGVGGADLGYRFGFVELFGSVQGGGARANVDPIEGHATFVDVGAGIRIYPVKRGRVDPYVGASLGYNRFALVDRTAELEYRAHSSRGAFRPGAGLMVYVTEKLSLGPRFDVSFPFAGELCYGFEGESRQCIDIKDLVEEETDTDFEERSYRRSFARMWALTFFVTRKF